MIEIVFLACSIVVGPTCVEKTITFFEQPGSISTFSCGFYGQVELAKWRSANPNWCVPRGYKCRPAGVMAKA
jgi:hypothetical protein